MSRTGHAMATFRGQRIPHFNIIGRRKMWFAISGALVVISIIGLFYPGLKLSIDFEGGASLQSPNPGGATVEELRAVMGTYGRGDAEVQVVAGGEVAIRTSSLNDLGERRAELLQSVAEATGVPPDSINVEDIGPSWGGQISSKMLQALVIFLVLVTVYISFRFEWKMAVGALSALFHDVVITAGIYALLGREVTPETVIAILTILGFSLYDTVVIYDKIKENVEQPALVGREGYANVVNLSLNQTIMRSVNTSLVVILPIVALLLFGGETLKDFAFALFIGTLVGTYSSIFVAAPLLSVLKEREPRYRPKTARPPRAEKTGAPAPAAAAVAVAPSGASTGQVVQARPRKKKSSAKRHRR